MKDATQRAKKFASLLKKLPAVEPPAYPDSDDPMAVLVQSLLLMDATPDKAIGAYTRLMEHAVDFNDLRVTMADEMAASMGGRYPRAVERANIIRTVLRSVYLREHEVTLGSLAGLGKREVRKYVESLDGMVPFAAARVMMMSFDTHAIPVDESLRSALIAEGILDEDVDAAEASSWLARQIKASGGNAAAHALHAWAAERPPAKPSRKKSEKKTGRKKTATTKAASRKTTTKASKDAADEGKKTRKTSTKKTTRKKATTSRSR